MNDRQWIYMARKEGDVAMSSFLTSSQVACHRDDGVSPVNSSAEAVPELATEATSPAREQFARIVQQDHSYLRGIALRLCGNTADADDLLQETYERGLRGVHRFESGSNARAWLATIMQNRFIDRCRKQTRTPRGEPLDDIPVVTPDSEPAPVWAAVTMDHLRAALEQLDRRYREVFELFTFEKQSYHEIAERLGIRPTTVGTRLNRARCRLRVVLLEFVTLQQGVSK